MQYFNLTVHILIYETKIEVEKFYLYVWKIRQNKYIRLLKPNRLAPPFFVP